MPPANEPQQRINPQKSPVDTRLERLRDKVFPTSPYLLTVPTTYRVSSHQANDWRRGSPFGAHEEQLQYLTFLTRERDDTLLGAVGDWDDGNGAIMEKTSSHPYGARSGTNSPLPGQAPKKKISFQAYKNKTAGQAGGKTLPKVNEEPISQEATKAANAPVEKAIESIKKGPQLGQKR